MVFSDRTSVFTFVNETQIDGKLLLKLKEAKTNSWRRPFVNDIPFIIKKKSNWL
jgi:hypothetical protein